MYDNTSRVIEIDINEILPNRFQPRIKFDEDEILELSDSIKEHGVIQPIIVRTIGDKYEIIAGERRYKAAVLAGLDTVPIIVKNLSDQESAEIALIENVQRRNLTPIEEALSYKKILDMGNLKQEDLAEKLGKSQSAVANKIRLLNLSDEVQEALLENKISERHARSLLRLKTTASQNEMLDRIITERLTVRKTDEEIDKINEIKEEERGNEDMNNTMPEMPAMAPVAPVMPEVPAVEPVAPVAPAMPEVPAVEPVAPVAPVMPEVPAVEPVAPVAPVMPEVPAVEPVAPVAPAMPEVPAVEPVAPVAPAMPEVPAVEPVASAVDSITSGGFSFDENGNVIAVPEETSIEEVPAVEPVAPIAEVSNPSFDIFSAAPVPETPTVEPVAPVAPAMPEVPVTTPILDTPQPVVEEPVVAPTVETPAVEATPVETETIAEPVQPEPIIVTDYSKQYDPVMPESYNQPQEKADFKEVINAIRECQSKIEQYGYKIDMEEYDLTNLYQVIIKIEK